MIHLQRTHTINATPQAVWNILGRYMHIDEFAPLITSVDALTDGPDGLGSIRRNHFENGTSLTEEVIAWQPGQGFTVKLGDMAAMPLHAATSLVRITPKNGQSEVTWTFDFTVKYGILGWLMGQTLMKMAMSKIIDGNLKGLADKVRTQESIPAKSSAAPAL